MSLYMEVLNAKMEYVVESQKPRLLECFSNSLSTGPIGDFDSEFCSGPPSASSHSGYVPGLFGGFPPLRHVYNTF